MIFIRSYTLAVGYQSNDRQEVVGHCGILIQLFHDLKIEMIRKSYMKQCSKPKHKLIICQNQLYHILHFFREDFHQGVCGELFHRIVLDLKTKTDIRRVAIMSVEMVTAPLGRSAYVMYAKSQIVLEKKEVILSNIQYNIHAIT